MISSYQEIIEISKCMVKLGAISILTEFAILFQYKATLRKSHLEALYLTVHYLSQNELKRVMLDPSILGIYESKHCKDEKEGPRHFQEPLGEKVISVLEYADNARNIVTHR